MAYLMFFARKMDLQSRINDQQYKLDQKQREVEELAAYTAAIGDGEVSMNDLTTVPASMFGRLSQYMVGSHNYASQAAQQNYAYLAGAGQTGAQGQAQSQYQYLVMKNLYDQQKAQFQKAEEAKLHAKEKQLENQKTKIEQQLKLLEAEYQQVSNACDKAASEQAPKYA